MPKKKNQKKRREPIIDTTPQTATPPSGGLHALRETLESIVIAFVLAFLFRTFEAEAFVIPTGSMSPSLQGQHKDLCCSECEYRFRTTASTEGDERAKLIANGQDPSLVDTVAGMCPMCRQTIIYHKNFTKDIPSYINQQDFEPTSTYPGDRILVNKYIYANRDPDRWDVVVFKFPGNGEMNYIKRLVGLPNETLQIYQGDIFIRSENDDQNGFQIERKPADKIRVMLQPVHDTDYDPSILYNAGWPLRWGSESPQGWDIEIQAGEKKVQQLYRYDAKTNANKESVDWLSYRHLIPTDNDWLIAREFTQNGRYPGTSKQQWLDNIRPALIRDFNPYNARLMRNDVRKNGWSMMPRCRGKNWVSDLALECEVEIEEATGELLLDLVEGGKHFICRINLEDGSVGFSADGKPYASSHSQDTATQDTDSNTYSMAINKTDLNQPGKHRLLFCNVDDQLILWVDDELVRLDNTLAGLQYDADSLYGNRANNLPTTSENDLGDLAPVRMGARGAKLTVHNLKVMRDIYYVSVRAGSAGSSTSQDYPSTSLQLVDGNYIPVPASDYQLFTDPATWPRFKKRNKQTFEIDTDQFFVLGDNSPESLDCRLWVTPNAMTGAKPGGHYLDRRLLIGKAVCVFWPHSWGSIPGIPILPGFPGFGDMRIVR